MKKESKKPVCPKCEGRQTYYRIESNSHMCRTCGHTWEKKK